MSSKGKQPISFTAPSSSSPANSLASLWAYLLPALDHIVKSSTNDPSRAPSIDVALYSGIHSACYNYITSSAEGAAAARKFAIGDTTDSNSGTDLYKQLDQYFTEVAREFLLGAPQDDDSSLVRYLVPCFNRYSAGVFSVNRLLNYVNRHYVRRHIDEDHGWFSINDLLAQMAKTIKSDDTREQLAKRIQELRTNELKKWGYVEGGSRELIAQAEASAEAGSPPDRVVPISSMAHRRFRTEVIEPLLAIPKIPGKKPKNKIPKAGGGSVPSGPKGRLARSVKHLLESAEVDEAERLSLAGDMSKMFRLIGVRLDHPLRKKLDKSQHS